jgi:hypothetical protein
MLNTEYARDTLVSESHVLYIVTFNYLCIRKQLVADRMRYNT